MHTISLNTEGGLFKKYYYYYQTNKKKLKYQHSYIVRNQKGVGSSTAYLPSLDVILETSELEAHLEHSNF